MKKSIQGKGLYAILDSGYLDPSLMIETAQKMVKGGCKLIQLRDKISSLSYPVHLAQKIKEILPADVIFMINDDVHLVKAVGADGVHLGQEDLSIEEARTILGNDLIIGLSTHSYSQAMDSLEKDVDYIGFGPIYKTKTKPMSIPTGLEELSRVSREVCHPVFAIGGIQMENIEAVLARGSEGVTLVSAILESADIQTTVAQFISKINDLKSTIPR